MYTGTLVHHLQTAGCGARARPWRWGEPKNLALETYEGEMEGLRALNGDVNALRKEGQCNLIPIENRDERAWFHRWTLKCDGLLSSFAFN